MEQHGKNHSQKVFAIIPARFSSTRLAGKLLLEIENKPLILHTLEQTKKARNIDRIIVATDDERILKIVNGSGNEAVLTSTEHQSGSDRIAEVAENLPENSIIVNVQGDEPTISPRTIEAAVEAILQDENADISTTCERIKTAEDVLNPNIVKVVTGENDYALYFSRSPIPFPRDAVNKSGTIEAALQNDENLLALYRKHTGLYVYRREYLLKFTRLEQTNLEKAEMLEQLRALENGARIKVVGVAESSIGVDTAEDFERVRQIFESEKIIYREAAAADIPQIARVHVESWKRSFAGIAPQDYLDRMSVEKRIGQFEKAFSQTSFYKMFVTETLEKEIVGFADFGKSRGDNGFDAEIYAFYFLPEFQRKGIGGKLLRRCQREMLGNGINSMSLEALKVSPYRKFYEKMGGRVVGEGKYSLGGTEFETVIYGWDDLQANG